MLFSANLLRLMKTPSFKGGIWSHPSAVGSGCLYVNMKDGSLISHLLIMLKVFSKVVYPYALFWPIFILHLKNREGGGRENLESFKETKEKSELCSTLDKFLKYLSPHLPQQAAIIPKVIYKKSSKESSAKGSFPEALWGLWLEGLDAADSWGKRRQREGKKKRSLNDRTWKQKNVMKEEVIFVLLSLINIKAVFRDKGIIKTKVSITCQVKGYPNGMCFSENKLFLKFQRNKVFYSKRSIKADPWLRLLLWVGEEEKEVFVIFFFLIEGRWLPVSRLSKAMWSPTSVQTKRI